MENAKPSSTTIPAYWLLLRTLVITIACALVVVGCQRDSPEQVLRQQLQDMQAAIEARKPRDFMQGVSEDFAGNNGMDHAALHNLLRTQVLLRSQVGVTTGPLEVRVEGESATVKFSVLLTGGSGGLLPDSAQAYTITSGWRQQQGQWRVYYAQWEASR